MVEKNDNNAELGYWFGERFWNKGYATEAASGTIKYGFEKAGLHKIFARHFVDNPASGRVMEKNKMICEGTLKSHHQRFGQYHDICYYGIFNPKN